MKRLLIVGFGPGAPGYLTADAKHALESAEILCGYTLYLDLLRPLFPEKIFLASGMTGETERCRTALRHASLGKTTALVCSGDAGIYGLASPAMEAASEYPDVEIEVIPGVTAASSGAALLGAPLGHDFCVISLSDRLTDWSVIENRLRCAAGGDFVICLYNPASKHRPDTLRRACSILMETKQEDTVCGMVRNIGRDGQSLCVLTLGQLLDADADMFTTVFIGSSHTIKIGGRIVTPRGYPI